MNNNLTLRHFMGKRRVTIFNPVPQSPPKASGLMLSSWTLWDFTIYLDSSGHILKSINLNIVALVPRAVQRCRELISDLLSNYQVEGTLLSIEAGAIWGGFRLVLLYVSSFTGGTGNLSGIIMFRHKEIINCVQKCMIMLLECYRGWE